MPLPMQRSEGHADDEDALARDEPLLVLLAAASLRTRIATGAHQIRNHGILALSASMRDRIVPQPMAHPPEGESAESVQGSR